MTDRRVFGGVEIDEVGTDALAMLARVSDLCRVLLNMGTTPEVHVVINVDEGEESQLQRKAKLPPEHPMQRSWSPPLGDFATAPLTPEDVAMSAVDDEPLQGFPPAEVREPISESAAAILGAEHVVVSPLRAPSTPHDVTNHDVTNVAGDFEPIEALRTRGARVFPQPAASTLPAVNGAVVEAPVERVTSLMADAVDDAGDPPPSTGEIDVVWDGLTSGRRLNLRGVKRPVSQAVLRRALAEMVERLGRSPTLDDWADQAPAWAPNAAVTSGILGMTWTEIGEWLASDRQ